MIRRTTLGPVSHSGLNARASMGAPRPPNPRSGLYNKPGDERRQSAVPSYGGGSRRATATGAVGRRATSTAVMGSGANPNRPGSRLSSRPSMTYSNRAGMRDPRPLHDRHYMQQCVKNLISFVIDRGYDQPISPKILTNPSSRDFQHIFLFLVRRIDSTFVFKKRFEDEVPAILRALGYPFSISKSALSAVGSPHTWPTLLGVLTWLMGLLKYDEARQEREDADQELDPIARRLNIFYNNMVQAYEQFLLGADNFPELDEELNQHFSAENDRRQAEIAKLQADRDELAATLDALQTQPSPLELSNEHRISLETNIHKFELLIPSLIEHHSSLTKKRKAKESEIEKEEAELASLVDEKQQLLESLASQEDAGIDAERIVADEERLRHRLDKLTTERTHAETGQRQLEQELAAAISSLQDKLRTYHKHAASLESASSKEVDWEISVSSDDSITDPAGMLSKNIEKDVFPVIKIIKEEASAEVPKLQETILSLQEQTDEAEEQLIVNRSATSLLESRKANLESDYKKQRAEMTSKLESRRLAILQKEEEVRNAMQAARMAEDDLRVTEELLRTTKETISRQRKRLLAVAERDIQTFSRHQESVKCSVEEVLSHYEREAATSGTQQI